MVKVCLIVKFKHNKFECDSDLVRINSQKKSGEN